MGPEWVGVMVVVVDSVRASWRRRWWALEAILRGAIGWSGRIIEDSRCETLVIDCGEGFMQDSAALAWSISMTLRLRDFFWCTGL